MTVWVHQVDQDVLRGLSLAEVLMKVFQLARHQTAVFPRHLRVLVFDYLLDGVHALDAVEHHEVYLLSLYGGLGLLPCFGHQYIEHDNVSHVVAHHANCVEDIVQ